MIGSRRKWHLIIPYDLLIIACWHEFSTNIPFYITSSNRLGHVTGLAYIPASSLFPCFPSTSTTCSIPIIQPMDHIAFYGTVIHSLSPSSLSILQNTLVVAGAGKIHSIHPNLPAEQISTTIQENGYAFLQVHRLTDREFLIPGFVDTHNHAPQWTQRGVGRGIPLLEWLDKVTFAHETKFKDPDYARRTYRSCVTGFLKQGVTTAAYYGSHHPNASKVLVDVCLDLGQRALVGKCNMDRNAPDWYRDSSAEASVSETRDFIDYARRRSNGLVSPVLTPRFAISCSDLLLQGLGRLAAENPDLPIQTHFNEARDEIQFTKSLFPDFKTESDLYGRFGLFSDRSILAHSIFLADDEIQRLNEANCGISHCSISNTTMQEFMIAPIREYLRRGIKVGLGSDSGGGYSSSMLEVMKQAFLVSNARQTLTDGRDPALSLEECFFLATLGGAQVCGLADCTGNFEPGKEFDALIIRADVDGVMTPVEEGDSLREIWEKFMMTGDDRNIVQVYVRGRLVKG